MRTVSLSVPVAMCCSFSEASIPWKHSMSAGSATGSFTLCASQRRFFRA